MFSSLGKKKNYIDLQKEGRRRPSTYGLFTYIKDSFRMVHVGRYNIRSVLTQFETVEHYKYPY